jgi:hypothetical protein
MSVQVAVSLLDNQETTLTFTPLDADGNPTPIVTPVKYTSLDTTGGISITDNGNGTCLLQTALTSGHLGNFEVDATDGTETVQFMIAVSASGEANAQGSFSTPVTQTPSAPPAVPGT